MTSHHPLKYFTAVCALIVVFCSLFFTSIPQQLQAQSIFTGDQPQSSIFDNGSNSGNTINFSDGPGNGSTGGVPTASPNNPATGGVPTQTPNNPSTGGVPTPPPNNPTTGGVATPPPDNPTTGGVPTDSTYSNYTKFGNICELVQAFINIVAEVGAIVAVLFIIWSGFLFIKAQGNPEELKKAKTTFKNTIIGTMILLSSTIIVKVIVNTVETITSKTTGAGSICPATTGLPTDSGGRIVDPENPDFN